MTKFIIKFSGLKQLILTATNEDLNKSNVLSFAILKITNLTKSTLFEI